MGNVEEELCTDFSRFELGECFEGQNDKFKFLERILSIIPEFLSRLSNI